MHTWNTGWWIEREGSEGNKEHLRWGPRYKNYKGLFGTLESHKTDEERRRRKRTRRWRRRKRRKARRRSRGRGIGKEEEKEEKTKTWKIIFQWIKGDSDQTLNDSLSYSRSLSYWADVFLLEPAIILKDCICSYSRYKTGSVTR